MSKRTQDVLSMIFVLSISTLFVAMAYWFAVRN